jgi:putative ABC transport system ATP-binding protein
MLRGPSGSGKTTLLDLIGGVVRPSSGRVSTLGVDLGAASAGDRARFRRDNVGFVFQDFRLIDELTAWENVAVPLWLRAVDRREARERAFATIAALGLADLAHRRPAELSGGEQQRIGFARATVGRPRLVLADEPTANLDDASAEAVEDLLRQARADGGVVIVATHDARLRSPGDIEFRVEAGTIVPEGNVGSGPSRVAPPDGRLRSVVWP